MYATHYELETVWITRECVLCHEKMPVSYPKSMKSISKENRRAFLKEQEEKSPFICPECFKKEP